MRAKDIMTIRCITVSPSTTVSEVARTLLKHHFSAVPVVDDAGGVVGIVSEGDLIRRVEAGTDTKPRSWWLRAVVSPETLAGEYVKSHAKKARDVMTSPAVTVTEDTAVADIATLLESRQIKRVPVVRGGKPVGIVSRANLLQALAAGDGLALPAASDDEIRRRLTAALAKQPWASVGSTNVTVAKGVVTLWGIVESAAEKQATRVAAEAIPGVVQVVDHRVLHAAVGAGY